MSWDELAQSDPELATAGRRLLERGAKAPIGFLATSSPSGLPRISPVCPIFCAGEMYLSVGAHTPKVKDLLQSGRYALHTFPGGSDEEFRVSGHAELVSDPDERARVHASIRFPVFNPGDPVFRLQLESCLWSRWDGPSERPSQRRTWRR